MLRIHTSFEIRGYDAIHTMHTPLTRQQHHTPQQFPPTSMLAHSQHLKISPHNCSFARLTDSNRDGERTAYCYQSIVNKTRCLERKVFWYDSPARKDPTSEQEGLSSLVDIASSLRTLRGMHILVLCVIYQQQRYKAHFQERV